MAQVYTVTQISTLIKETLESSFGVVTIEGEISGFKHHSSGHLYFSLKDSGATINAVMFRGDAQRLNFDPQDGDKVKATGRITTYILQGKYQIVVNILAKSGEGDLLAKIEQLKRRLNNEGLFAAEHKRRLPSFPQKIGVVTSSTGAAFQDIIRVTKSRNKTVSIVLFPALVQGIGAPDTIIKAINAANQYNSHIESKIDVLIVGRGGGSIEDLLPFSDEGVVRAVYNSKIPVVSAVGHEIDWSLCDFAADVRAATPSNAAEICVPLLSEIMATILAYKTQMHDAMLSKIADVRLRYAMFDPENAARAVLLLEQPILLAVQKAHDAINTQMHTIISTFAQRMATSKAALELANPTAVVERGYAIVKDASGNVIKSVKSATPGSTISTLVADGEFQSVVS